MERDLCASKTEFGNMTTLFLKLIDLELERFQTKFEHNVTLNSRENRVLTSSSLLCKKNHSAYHIQKFLQICQNYLTDT